VLGERVRVHEPDVRGVDGQVPGVVLRPGDGLCNDDNACTSDDCVANECVYTPSVTCPDDNACSQFSCDSVSGLCVETVTVCDDGSACTRDTCNGTTGCVYTPITCSDNSLCTIDSCDPLSGCVYTNVTCDSGSMCTSDICQPSRGCVYTNITCNDGSFLTVDSCDPLTGCVYTPIVCDDGNNCTLDTVTPNGCSYTPIACNPPSLCEVGSCVAPQGCVYTQKSCPLPDPVCQESFCLPGNGQCALVSRTCDDGNPCTRDSCDSVLGCVYEPITCANISTCLNYRCEGVFNNVTDEIEPQCVVESEVNCVDDDSCTEDACVEGIGCTHINITCAPTTECDFPTGCIGTGPEPECIYQNITSLFDFCGTCRGNNADCFFQSTLGNEAIIGISAGVAVGITAAVICGVAIALYLSKKSFDYYKARSDHAAASLHMNPYFKKTELQGDMPDMTARAGVDI